MAQNQLYIVECTVSACHIHLLQRDHKMVGIKKIVCVGIVTALNPNGLDAYFLNRAVWNADTGNCHVYFNGIAQYVALIK